MSDLRDRLQAAVAETYRIEDELGGGGMSRVFLAEETRLGRQVVIKVLPPEMGAGVNVDRFEREIQLAARLQHPHIVPLLTAGSEGDLLWYVMPFIKGESLRAKLAREGELPVADTVRILKEVTDALQHAHSEQVVHRDIKPDNVLLSGHHAVVTDFGVAKAVSASTGEANLTSLGVALGTPAYMSPEQAAAEPHVDHRADIYAVGVMAYEMLTGRPPFTGTTAQQVLAAHITNVPDPVTAHRATVPAALNEVILRCLHKKPADRFQRVEDIVPHLDALLTPSGGMTPTGTQPVAAIDYAARVKRSHPLRVAGLYGLASLSTLALVYLVTRLAGLPDWVFGGAVGLVAIGLPIVLLTGHRERRRAVASMTSIQIATPTGIERHLTWRKALSGGALAFGGLGLISTTFMAMRLFGIGPAATLVTSGVLEERDRLVLADFENRTSDTTLGRTVTELFRIDLAQSPTVTVLDPSQIDQVLQRMQRSPGEPLTLEIASELAEREGLKAVVTGEIASVGSGFVLSSRLVSSPGGEVLAAARENAKSADDIVAAIDRLSADLRERVGESLRSIRANEPLNRVTTRSMTALHKYVQGVNAFGEGDSERAIALLEEAVAADTGFAMAYRKLGAALWSRGADGRDAMRQALTDAYERRHRLTEREQLATIGIYQSDVLEDDEASERTYRSLLEKYPDDVTALHNLARQYGRLNRPDEAVEMYERAIEVGGASVGTYRGLLTRLANDYERTERTVDRLAVEYPQAEEVWERRARLAAARFDYDAAAQYVDSLDETNRGGRQWELGVLRARAELAQIRGQTTASERFEREANALTRDEMADSLRPLIDLYDALDRVEMEILVRGDTSSAGRLLDEAVANHPLAALPAENRPHDRLLELYGMLGRTDEARRAYADFDAQLEERDWETELKDARRQVARGHLALAEGRAGDAVTEFRARRMDQEACSICFRFELAAAHDAAGNADSAVAAYQDYLGAEYVFRSSWDQRVLALVYRRLGELYEGQGDTANALEYFNRFVELWQDADPDLQSQVEDVRMRMARLAGEGR